MPWRIVPNHPACPTTRPVGVVNEQTGRVACHRNEASARVQVAIMREAEGLDDDNTPDH